MSASAVGFTCADCGCFVDRGVIITACDQHPACCCGELTVREAEPGPATPE